MCRQQAIVSKPLTATFDQAHVSSDGGSRLLKAADRSLGLTSALAQAMPGPAGGARREQLELNGVEAQIAVVNAGSTFWADALAWGSERGLLSPTEHGVLGMVAIPAGRTPTERQASRAVEAGLKIRATDVVDEERKTLKSAVANLVMDNELLRGRIRQLEQEKPFLRWRSKPKNRGRC